MSAAPTHILLITPQYLIDNSVINSNVEQKLLTKAIRVASDKFLMPLIGSSLYEEIISQITGGTISAGANKVLLDTYIIPTLVEYSTYVYIDFTALKFRNKGIQRQTGENSETVSVEDLGYLKQSCLDTCQFYAERLIKFLKANIQSYPTYYAYSTIDSVTPAQNDYFSGIQFPRSNRNDNGLLGLGIDIPINF